MKSQCLPFSQIPHTTKLFADFIAYSPQVQRFYPHSPRLIDWAKDEEKSSRPGYDPERRQRVSAVLERQNKAWSASPKTMENIARLRAGASAVVTGQQVGLFGGPMFSVFKALSAAKLADQASSAGADSVPIFWLATEDHDLAEVNHVSFIGPDASLRKLSVSTHGVEDSPVGAIRFGVEIEPVVAEAAELFGDSEIAAFLRESYRPGETFGSAFARLFARLFAEWGIILLDAADPELHQIATPIYQAAIERAAELDHALLARGKELEAAGYHQQVKVTSSSTLLFALHDGARVPIQRSETTASEAGFVIRKGKVSQEGLLRHIAAAPADFSGNALLRPVLQDFLLPTLAYTGGPAEVAYFAQAAVIYQALLGRITPVIPRFSATLIEPKPQVLLDRYALSLSDFFSGPEAVRQHLAKSALPQELQQAFDQAEANLEKSLAAIREGLATLDQTLVDSATHAGEKMRYQLSQLRGKAARAELRQTEVLSRHAELLGNTLYPNKTLQERELAGICVLAREGADLLHRLYENIHTDCFDHHVITL